MNWNEFVKTESEKSYFKDLEAFLAREYKNKTIFPKVDEIVLAYKLTPLNKIKVVILGQDPYYNEGKAMGLAFSVKKGAEIPPSLINIYKEIDRDYEREYVPRKDGDLTFLAKQGVFLLNTILTVEKDKPLSHKDKGWEIFTDNTIIEICKTKTPTVFLLWGKSASKKLPLIKENVIKEKPLLVLETSHPSPLGAHSGFIGCGHFKKANDFLAKFNEETINWIENT